MRFRRYAHVLILTALLATLDARADDRLERIMMLWPSGDYANLRVQIDDALRAYHATRDPQHEAVACLFLSLLDLSLRDVHSTRLHFGDAMTLFKEAGDCVGLWLAYWMFAEHERLLGADSQNALAFYEKAFVMLEKAKPPSASFSIDALMVVGPLVGLPPDDYEPIPTTHDVNKPAVIRLLDVFTRIGYGGEFVQIGELQRADQQLRQAKADAAIFNGRLDPPIDRFIGKLRRRQWRLDEARESYLKALDGLQILRPVGTITAARLRVDIMDDLADLDVLKGRIDDALAWNDRALDLVRAGKSEEAEAVFLQRRAEILTRAGRFTAAEPVFAQALALAEKIENFGLQVSIHLRAAQMNQDRGRYGAAAGDTEKALEALSQANQPLREPSIWSNLAMVYHLLGADDIAETALERMRRTSNDNEQNCLTLAAMNLFDSSWKFLTYKTSDVAFSKAVEQFTKTPDAKSVPGVDQFAPLIALFVGSAPADPQVLFPGGASSGHGRAPSGGEAL